jgi:uncharacterized protein YigE (DUF2233 family)
MEYERSAYTICEVDLRKQTIRLHWKRADGTPYAYLSALPRALEGETGKAVRDLLGAVQSSLRNHKGTAVVEDVSAHLAQWALREVP